MKRVRWLATRAVEAIHYELILRYGGVAGVRDRGALESALARPKHLLVYRSRITLPQLAAAYGWGLLRNHPFVDGNKRVAFAAMIAFLELNGWKWLASEVEETVNVLAAAEGELPEKDWISWVIRNTVRRKP
jgi:death-on-curing protein